MGMVPSKPVHSSSSKQRKNVDYPGRKRRSPRNRRRHRDLKILYAFFMYLYDIYKPTYRDSGIAVKKLLNLSTFMMNSPCGILLRCTVWIESDCKLSWVLVTVSLSLSFQHASPMPSNPLKLTIKITLIRIVDVTTVIAPVGYTISVDVVVAFVAYAVTIAVVLSGIRHVRTIVLVILDTIPIAIRVGIANIPHAIAVDIILVSIANTRTIVTDIADAVRIGIALI
ncbi:hypothetical protein ALC57_12359 [Trachymyrmex cornetzi]|uniref:Uncharacterized protein n=1 Tax=Trachymyrmex cornetzi TaxID=471704 RepID=A0A195DQX0_9HYME|nr:hypothetical protein ALC57_12359 [Trachymyrmex cornetzi]